MFRVCLFPRINQAKCVANSPLTKQSSASIQSDASKDHSSSALELRYLEMQKKTARLKEMILEDEKKPLKQRRYKTIDYDALDKALNKAKENHKRSIYG